VLVDKSRGVQQFLLISLAAIAGGLLSFWHCVHSTAFAAAGGNISVLQTKSLHNGDAPPVVRKVALILLLL